VDELVNTVNLEELNSFADEFANALKPSDVVFFEGPMGAGKTTLISAICASLKTKEAVSSPTYAVMHEYESDSFLVQHFDFFKVKPGDYLYEMAVEQFPNVEAVTFVEWPQNLSNDLQDCATINIKLGKVPNDDYKRTIGVCR
jgi:tRNA threonylcarbamoyladenosine biosynthesis protein TsaE